MSSAVLSTSPRTLLNSVYRAILTGFPLLRLSSSASSCASRSMRSASLLISRDRSKPVTFLPQVVLNASRAAETATSMSFSDAIRGRKKRDSESEPAALLRSAACHLREALIERGG